VTQCDLSVSYSDSSCASVASDALHCARTLRELSHTRLDYHAISALTLPVSTISTAIFYYDFLQLEVSQERNYFSIADRTVLGASPEYDNTNKVRRNTLL
jgi:hypothetical protein